MSEYPIRGFCTECDGPAERLAYETLPDSGIGVCMRCCEEMNRVDPAEDEREHWDEEDFADVCEEHELKPEAFNKEHRDAE